MFSAHWQKTVFQKMHQTENFPSGSVVKNPSAMKETQVRSLVWEDPLEKETAARSSILAWRILQTEEPGGLPSMGLQRVRHDLVTNNNNKSDHDLRRHKSFSVTD